jgi:N4-gp56 family major capsid protein
MPTTDFGALSSAKKRVWASQIWMAGRDQNFFMANGFVSDGINSVIQRINELTETARGRVCVMQLVGDLAGDGVVGDNLLEGREEAMWNDTLEIRIDQIRNGVRSKGKMAEQDTVVRFRAVGKERLAFWLADKIDELMFLTLSGTAYTKNLDGSTRSTSSQLSSLTFAADVTAPSSARIMYAGTNTSTATLTTADKMNWNLIVNAQAQAKRKRIKPIRSSGRDYYAFLLSTEQARDLKTDSTYQTNVGRAGAKGDSNPLFKGAMAVIDGAVIYDHQKVPNTLGLASSSKWGASGTVDGAQATLLGAQSLGLALLGNVDYSESDNTDYQNRPGMAVGRVIGMVKPKYQSKYDSRTSQDFGLLSIYTAAGATQ